MTGAVFVLAINIAIVCVMATAFFVLGHFDPRNRAANWFGLAYMAAALSFAGEYVLLAGYAQGASRMVIALAMLAAFLIVAHGLALRYRLAISPLWLLALFGASTGLYALILDMPRADFLRQMLYQLPYVIVSGLGVAIVWASRQRRAIDIALLLTLAAMMASFAAKPFIALVTGGVGDAATDYALTLYALISQSSGAVSGLLLAMLCLAISIMDSAGTLVAQAARDSETGLLNERAFTSQGTDLLTRTRNLDESAPAHSAALILFEIDPDPDRTELIIFSDALGSTLTAIAGAQALVGRLSAARFGLLIPATSLFAARALAETLRIQVTAVLARGAPPISLSVGISEREANDSFSELLLRAQWALDEARRAGGNCVRLAARSALGRHQTG